MRATDPLYGRGMARPAATTYGGSGEPSSAGASTLTSCPRAISASARSTMWFCTPPGTSNEYGDTMPIRTSASPSGPAGHVGGGGLGYAGRRLVQPEPLQHVPVLRVPGDARGQGVGDALGEQPGTDVQGAL